MADDNDIRGWILTCLSGLACVFGALIVFTDHVIRLFPGQKSFKIQDSNSFLSSALSLSAGVMLFSGLYKMLPHSRQSLIEGGLSPKAAAWVLLVCFLGGSGGILLLSRVCHHFMPTEVVDCDHTHEDGEEDEDEEDKLHDHEHGVLHIHGNGTVEPRREYLDSEERPLLSRNDSEDPRARLYASINSSKTDSPPARPEGRKASTTSLRRTITRFVVGGKAYCDEGGPCHGYSDPCGQECFRNIMARGNARWSLSRPPIRRALSTGRDFSAIIEETDIDISPTPPSQLTPALAHHHHPPSRQRSLSPGLASDPEAQPTTPRPQHHHHVPKNAFLSLSLQTSIAITVHKLPEGFITYATNHANPKLGLSVFVALALHNVTEGFALSLPLYLATQSRARAFAYSTVLGGLSQPLGAGIAALWLGLSEKGQGAWAPTDRVYGEMFAATAGIMVAVALSLMQEAFGLGHYKGLCVASVFVGMALLAVASALTA